LLLLVWIICLPFSRRAGARAPAKVAEAGGSLLQAAQVVRRSSYLFLLVLLIGIVQVVVTLVDLEYNTVLEQTFPDTDERTSVIGRVYAAISVATLVLHALTGAILRLTGVPLVLLAVPALLAVGLVAYAGHPRFLMATVLKGASKVFDYTIFRAAKEILYIPLSYTERTLGKSVVDLLTYRLAKGAIALVLALVALVAAATDYSVPTAHVLCLVWIGITAVVVRRFRKVVSRAEEMRGPSEDDALPPEKSRDAGNRPGASDRSP
jgi:AAA family ATP:ADP antiporter